MAFIAKLRAKPEKAFDPKAHERTILVEMAGYYGLLGAAGVGALFLR